MKSDWIEDEKTIKINSSIFNKNFHIFKYKLTINKFKKYDGIDYISLLMEDYFQIINQICIDKNNYQENEKKRNYKTINQNIIFQIFWF